MPTDRPVQPDRSVQRIMGENAATTDRLVTMFNFGRKSKAEKASYIAAEHTTTPMDVPMTRMIAQELPVLDSTSRQRVNDILREYDGPTITSVEELPEEIREIMDLY